MAPKPVERKVSSRPQPAAIPEPPPTVSPRWLIGALGVTLILAATCGYAALCLLFYQGQWQMLFHPSRTVAITPAGVGMGFDDIRFDVTETGKPQLDGWWIPAGPSAPWASATILYLHDGRGSLATNLPALQRLHALGINVFAFDYRGFGLSEGAHPTEAMAREDAAAAFAYLTDTRRIAPRSVVVDGDGTGVVFAASLAAQFAPAGAILEDPGPTAREVFAADARAQILPLWMLQKEKLDPAVDLARTHVPRLFLDRSGDAARTRRLYELSSPPKQYFDLRSASDATLDATLRRFLDDVLH